MENLGYLLAAFVIVWVGLFGYVFSLFQKQKQLRRDIELLKEMLKKKPNRDIPK